MDINTIRRKIKDNSNQLDNLYRYYSTLVPIVQVNGQLHLLFEVRSSKLRRQPGEISFPGGKKEPGESFEEAAIRETMEELNISRKSIEVIGKLSPVSSHYNDVIHPFAGILHDAIIEDMDFNKAEVDHLFTVPINFFLENMPLEHYMETEPNPIEDFPYHLLPQGKNYTFFKGKYPVYFYEYQDYVIWGLTARTVKNFIDLLQS